MNDITINTVQGIGDIFWTYQKLAPYFDRISYNVLCTDDTNIVQRRSEKFCKMLPTVDRVRYRQVPHSYYQQVTRGHYSLQAVVDSYPQAADYAVNAPLEAGSNLYALDHDAAVLDYVGLVGVPHEPPTREDYLCVFVAGAKERSVWTPDQWPKPIAQLADRLGTGRIDLIGASWDRDVQACVQRVLESRFAVRNHVGADLATTINIIRRSRYFLGFQSGLNVLAENYDVPQLMIYFDKLEPMLYTWCKPSSVRTQFHATTFGSDVRRVIDELPLPSQENAP